MNEMKYEGYDPLVVNPLPQDWGEAERQVAQRLQALEQWRQQAAKAEEGL